MTLGLGEARTEGARRVEGGRGVRGWLAVLCGLLIVWEPLNLAGVAARLVPSLTHREPIVAGLLALRVAATGLGMVAGAALWSRRPHAVAITKLSLVLSTVVAIAILTTPFFPTNRLPGTTLPLVLLILLYNAGWFAYLVRSRKVKTTYSE